MLDCMACLMGSTPMAATEVLEYTLSDNLNTLDLGS
jgi:hypothetical protein